MLMTLVKDWNGHKSGRSIEVTDGVANVLLRRGIAAIQEHGQAVLQQAAETASLGKFMTRKKRQ